MAMSMEVNNILCTWIEGTHSFQQAVITLDYIRDDIDCVWSPIKCSSACKYIYVSDINNPYIPLSHRKG